MKLIMIIAISHLLAACSSEPDMLSYQHKNNTSRLNEIYIVNHGWHTGIIIPADTISKLIPALEDRFGDVKYLEIGWGDKGFYQAKEITVGLSLKAIFSPTESVVHVVSVDTDPESYFINSEIIRLCFNESEFEYLLKFIKNSFYHNDAGGVQSLVNGIYGDSQFYKGAGDYYLFNTCNKWTAKGLGSAGMDISPTFKLRAESVMAYLKSDEIDRLYTRACIASEM